uniref:(northern house mosquito) hypothetical protein n=1 Tax=Culex pipiens TaxID=7175 RepID=A0A8D8HAM3_CULPI
MPIFSRAVARVQRRTSCSKSRTTTTRETPRAIFYIHRRIPRKHTVMERRHNPTGSPHQTCPREFQASSGMFSSGLACTSTSSTTKTSRTKAVDRVGLVPRFRIGSIRT